MLLRVAFLAATLVSAHAGLFDFLNPDEPKVVATKDGMACSAPSQCATQPCEKWPVCVNC